MKMTNEIKKQIEEKFRIIQRITDALGFCNSTYDSFGKVLNTIQKITKEELAIIKEELKKFDE